MNTPRTALEECLRLSELAIPGPWEVDAYNDITSNGEDVLHVVGNYGSVECEATANLVTAAINLLRTHGKALSEALGEVEKLSAFKAATEYMLEGQPNNLASINAHAAGLLATSAKGSGE